MARNDRLLLDGIIDERTESRLPSDKRDEAFEYFAFQQILRDADLSHEEIVFGSVDGRDDGGIDGLFILINGNLLQDVDRFPWPRSNGELVVYIVTCKHHDTFRQAPLDNLAATVSELLDLSVDSSELKGSYSQALLRKREQLSKAYRRLSPCLSRFSIQFSYASRGDVGEVAESIKARASQISHKAKDLFGDVDSVFQFMGSAELVSLHRKSRRREYELSFVDSLTHGSQYALLCRLSEYNRFLADENGALRRFMFDSNIRAFLGLKGVNDEIRATLASGRTPDFWWLNNGVTILATSAMIVGRSIAISEPQIVNGLQTSESIFRHFAKGGDDRQDRCVLVKVIVTTDSVARDKIIRATNTQSSVEAATLHATDKIQRDIEEYMLREGILYERRKNSYSGQGLASSDVVTPMYLAGGFVGLVLKSPLYASQLKSKVFRRQRAYNKIFSESTPIEVWPAIAKVLKKVDAKIDRLRPAGVAVGERYVKSFRQLVSLVCVSRVLGAFSFSAQELGQMDVANITDDLIEETWGDMVDVAGEGRLTASLSHSSSFVVSVCQRAIRRSEISGIECLSFGNPLEDPVARRSADGSSVSPGRRPWDFSEEFIEQVDAMLPKQPWLPRVHKVVAKQLNRPAANITWAIEQLVEKGRRYRQRDGLVFNEHGEVIDFDPDRVALVGDQYVIKNKDRSVKDNVRSDSGATEMGDDEK